MAGFVREWFALAAVVLKASVTPWERLVPAPGRGAQPAEPLSSPGELPCPVPEEGAAVSRPPTSGPPRRGGVRFWVLAMVVGLVLLASGGPRLINSLLFAATAEHAAGVIVNVRQDDGDYHPVVQFTAANGQRVKFWASETAGDRSTYRVDQQVGVLYSAHNPHDARLDTWQSRWGLTSIVPMLGTAIVALGFVDLLRARRANRRQPPAAVSPLAWGPDLKG